MSKPNETQCLVSKRVKNMFSDTILWHPYVSSRDPGSRVADLGSRIRDPQSGIQDPGSEIPQKKMIIRCHYTRTIPHSYLSNSICKYTLVASVMPLSFTTRLSPLQKTHVQNLWSDQFELVTFKKDHLRSMCSVVIALRQTRWLWQWLPVFRARRLNCAFSAQGAAGPWPVFCFSQRFCSVGA